MKIILRVYNAAEVKIGMLHGNQEFKGKFQEAVFDEFGITMNLSNPNEHVPDIERANRLLEERFRVHYYRMPFKVVPTVMIEQLALSITDHLTWFPAKEGISRHYSPYTILSPKVIDYKKRLVNSFGDYVQANHVHTIKNNNLPRSVDCIYL